MNHVDRVAGALLGVALGDALGLPFEGMSGEHVGRHFDERRFQLIGGTGFVSDDTEQSTLLAQALATADDEDRVLRAFRRAMVGWFARLPFGIGWGTLRACTRMALGLAEPGVASAGNGAAMRAGILGAHLSCDSKRRRELGRAVARLTHTDERAIQGALFAAEVTANAMTSPSASRKEFVERAREVVSEPQLADAIDRALELAQREVPLSEVVGALGNTGFVVHSMGISTYCFVRFEGVMPSITAAIRAGGDTDTHAAIVGGWAGAQHGASGLPKQLVSRLHDGPFGPTHIRALAVALVNGTEPPRWSWLHALLRNLALYPVIIAHGVRHLR